MKYNFRETVWNIRLEELQKNVLCHWSQFTIWNAGKQGRKFYRCLSDENKLKVNHGMPINNSAK